MIRAQLKEWRRRFVLKVHGSGTALETVELRSGIQARIDSARHTLATGSKRIAGFIGALILVSLGVSAFSQRGQRAA